MMGYDGFGLFGGLGMGFGMILWIVIAVLSIWALVALFNNHANRLEETPLAILRRRYASGQITRAEFEQARNNMA